MIAGLSAVAKTLIDGLIIAAFALIAGIVADAVTVAVGADIVTLTELEAITTGMFA
jgi:hypothetical protein